MTGSEPLILTLGFEGDSFARFDAMRRRHFPPERNHIPAHLTLFHHLPASRETDVRAELQALAMSKPQLILSVTGLRFLGHGTAYRLECPELLTVRRELADFWAGDLTPQDAQGFQPHVTIQNKAPATEAKRLFAQLQAAFEPFEARADALLLWRYLGGPWEPVARFEFNLSCK